MKQVWKCDDGTIYDSLTEASSHDRVMFAAWLKEMPCMELSSIWASLEDGDKDEFYGSSKDIGKVFLDKAYEMSLEDPSRVVFGRRNAMPVKK